MTTDDRSELERMLSDPTARAVLHAFMSITPTIASIVRSPDMKVLHVSAFAADLLGREVRELEGVPFSTYEAALQAFWPDGRPVATDDRLLVRAARGERVMNQEGLILDGRGELIPILCNAAPIRAASGELLGGVITCSDVRHLKALETELRVAYRELAHRVKNHLQIMSGLIALDARDPDLTAAELAEMNQARLKMLAAVYDGMAKAEAGRRIVAGAFVEQVCRPYRTRTIAVEARVSPDELTLDPDQAAPFGLLLNEAVCNSYKHGFPGGGGTVQVTLGREPPGRLVLEVADDGVGFRAEAPPRSHGLMLMRFQAEKLRARLDIGPRDGGGTLVRLDMPEAA
jgi:two-component sensor histidine kinase